MLISAARAVVTANRIDEGSTGSHGAEERNDDGEDTKEDANATNDLHENQHQKAILLCSFEAAVERRCHVFFSRILRELALDLEYSYSAMTLASLLFSLLHGNFLSIIPAVFSNSLSNKRETLTKKLLLTLPYCLRTPQHKGKDTRINMMIPTTIPPMEPPKSEAVKAASVDGCKVPKELI